MEKTTIIATALLLVHATAPAFPASAQIGGDIERSAVLAAAGYVVGEQIQDLPEQRPHLIVDVESGFDLGPAGKPINDRARAAAARLARDLGARPGRLSAVMNCPTGVPSPEAWARGDWGCKLNPGVTYVVQVDDPLIDGDTARVWIAVWRQSLDATGNRRHVTMRAAKVALERVAGKWVVIAAELEVSGVF